MLRDLTIQNYRCFKDFHIDDLARVNLIVGMNNSGKTSFLEAVHLLVNQGNPGGVVSVLLDRDETPKFGVEAKHIFNSYKLQTDQNIYIQSHEEHHISLEIKLKSWSNERVIPLPYDFVPAFELILVYDSEDAERAHSTIIPIDEDGTLEFIHLIGSNRPEASPQFRSQFYLTARNIDLDLLKVLWKTVTNTSKVEKVVAALKIIDPEVESINFTDEPDNKSYVFIKLNGQYTPVPLGSMGEGMRRILTLAITAVAVENGILLVDEIETGLHYEAQTDMWRLLIKIAQQLNVQVFATTHSWDCISAFQEALTLSEDRSVGKLFRLSRKGENIRAVDYPAEKLAVAVRQNIEVR